MERVMPAGMKESLERNRSALNSLFEYYRPVSREPDYDDVLSLFYSMILPVYTNGFIFSDDLLCGAFSTVLNLNSKGYIGREGRFKDVEKKFFTMLGIFAELFSSEKEFAAALFNALLNLYAKSPGAMDAWCEKIKLLNCVSDFEAFRKKGFILAWRYGMARYRSESVKMIESLKSDELCIIFDSDLLKKAGVEEFISSIKKDPWYNPFAMNHVGGPVFLHVDGFSGYGGHFNTVPDVFSFDGELFAADGNDIYRIYADSFGVELMHEPDLKPDKLSGDGAGMVYGITGKIVLNGKSYQLPDFSSGVIRSSASIGHTSAWTMQSSYKIFIAGISTGNV